MSNMKASINWNVDGDTELPVLLIERPFSDTEAEIIRLLLRDAFDRGYDNCRDERDRQAKDPSYPLHRRNPWDPATMQCKEACCTKVSPGQS